MTWPTTDVSTTNLDAGTDSPASARADIKEMADNVNLVKNHVSAYMQTVLDDSTAAAARTTLGAAASGSNTDITSLSAPALGSATATTQSADTTTTQVATTAFVIGQASDALPQPSGTAAAGTSKKYARADHVHAGPTARAWQDVLTSPGRTSGTTYTAPAYDIEVILGATAASGSPNVTVVVGGVTIINWTFPYGTSNPITFTVPAGATYSATFGAGTTLAKWSELR